MENMRQKTRDIYFEQHRNYRDPVLFQRFMDMFSDTDYYGVGADFFRGKTVLDAGCGNNAYFQLVMYRLGAKHMTCFDLGTDWMSELSGRLAEIDVPSDFVTLLEGDTTQIPLPDNSFDVVFSNGVLPHLSDLAEAELAFFECARTTKPGGSLYMSLGTPGGVMNKYVMPALRSAYQNEPDFRRAVDGLKAEQLQSLAKFVTGEHEKRTGEKTEADLERLFDVDLATFIQNALQVPKNLSNELTLEWALAMFEKHGFRTPHRCRRYVKRKNIRKYAAPLHFNLDHPISQMLYGDGYVELMAEKI